MKKALIIGLTGQDGSFLAEFLLGKGYIIFGLVRKETWSNPNNATHLESKINITFWDMSDTKKLIDILKVIQPDEIYNLASQSRPGESWSKLTETLMINGLGAVGLFEAVRCSCPKSKIYHASSSEMYGKSSNQTQDENTPLNPNNPYAAAKVYAHDMARIYRESYGLFIARGILFNHESERRPLNFVTQKIAYGAACAFLNIDLSKDLNELGEPIVSCGKLKLGNLDISRDWGYAKDFVKAMWLILQLDYPDDFVIGTGKLHTLRQLCQIAYGHVGINWADRVETNVNLIRPLETGHNLANPSKALNALNWKPTFSFEEMVCQMVDYQIHKLKIKS